MVKIEAIIQPHRLDSVKEALEAIGVKGITVIDVRGYGRQKGQAETYRGAEVRVDFIRKTKLELVVEDSMAQSIVDAIARTARTGNIGDGKIFISPIADVIRIRTLERGVQAI